MKEKEQIIISLCRYRLKIYSVIAVLSIIAAWWYWGRICDSSTKKDFISYLGTIITFLAMAIAYLEVLVTLKETKAVVTVAKDLLAQAKSVDRASLASDLVNQADNIILMINQEQYERVPSSFCVFQNLCSTYFPSVESEKNPFTDIETTLLRFSNSTSEGRPNKEQKHTVIEKIIVLRNKIRALNPVRESNNVTK